MRIIGQIKATKRKILYLQDPVNSDIKKCLPRKNWCVLVCADNCSEKEIQRVADICVKNNVCCVSGTGKQAELIHDIFDYVFGDIYGYDTDKGIMSDWEGNYEEAFWFAVNCAHHPYKNINTVVCLNLGKTNTFEKYVKLVKKINKGWIPSDEET